MSNLVRTGILAVTLACMFVLVPACKRTASKPAAVVAPDPKAAEKWGVEVERTMAKDDASFLASSLDANDLGKRVLAGLELSKSAERGFLAGFGAAVVEEFPRKLKDIVANGGTYKFLRIMELNGQKVAMFRMLSPNEGMQYHQWLLNVNGDKVNAVDVYVYSSGQYLSDMLRPMAVEGLKTENHKSWTNAIVAIAKRAQEQDWAGVLSLYRTLTPEQQKIKIMMIIRLSAAMHVSDEEYMQALKDYVAIFGDDASSALTTIDYDFLQKRYDRCLEKLDIIERDVGKDGYLELMRSSIWMEKGDLEKARSYAAQAARIEPEMKEAWWLQVDIALKRKDFDQTAKLLTHIEKKLGIELTDLSAEPLYAEFVQSPQHEAWMNSRQATTNP